MTSPAREMTDRQCRRASLNDCGLRDGHEGVCIPRGSAIPDAEGAEMTSESRESFDACTLPPAGWYCTREAGHDGPCAAPPTQGEATIEAPVVFRDLEWQVARMRRAIERYADREAEQEGKGHALAEHAREDLNRVVLAYAEALLLIRDDGES